MPTSKISLLSSDQFQLPFAASHDNTEDRLDYLFPQHEYFHQSMVVADCVSELFLDGSRGLDGAGFFAATLLNRKETQTSKGKNSLDSLKELFILKI